MLQTNALKNSVHVNGGTRGYEDSQNRLISWGIMKWFDDTDILLENLTIGFLQDLS